MPPYSNAHNPKTLPRYLWGMLIILIIFMVLKFTSLSEIYRRLNHPFIVLVTLDTLNLRYVTPYSPESKYTPNLAWFASQGALFERVYTQIPATLPSHTSLFTGLNPIQTRVMANGDQVPQNLTTLAEIFHSHGYNTAAFVSLGVLKMSFGLDQGFDLYDDDFQSQFHRWYRTADEVFKAAKGWILGQCPKPFFIWIHFSDPHEPYQSVSWRPDTQLFLDNNLIGEYNLTGNLQYEIIFQLGPGRHTLRWLNIRIPQHDDRTDTGIVLEIQSSHIIQKFLSPSSPPVPKETLLRPDYSLELYNNRDQTMSLRILFTGRLNNPPKSEVLRNYVQEVQYMDGYLGELFRLFRNLQIDQRTLWFIVSDHGEGLFYHNVLGHSSFVYEDQLRVAWLLKGPSVPPGRRITSGPVLIQDVTPTLLRAVGINPPQGMTGHSRWACVKKPSRCSGYDAWWGMGSEPNILYPPAFAMYLWPFKLIEYPLNKKRFYALLDDEWEDHPLSQKLNDVELEPVFEALYQNLNHNRPILRSHFRNRNQARWTDEQKALLQSLGYIDTSSKLNPENQGRKP